MHHRSDRGQEEQLRATQTDGSSLRTDVSSLEQATTTRERNDNPHDTTATYHHSSTNWPIEYKKHSPYCLKEYSYQQHERVQGLPHVRSWLLLHQLSNKLVHMYIQLRCFHSVSSTLRYTIFFHSHRSTVIAHHHHHSNIIIMKYKRPAQNHTRSQLRTSTLFWSNEKRRKSEEKDDDDDTSREDEEQQQQQDFFLSRVF